MKPLRFALAPLCVLLWVYFAGAQDESRAVLRRKLAAEIEKIAGSHDGVMGVAIKDLTTGEEILINDQLIFPTGSSIKIPILIELHKQAAEGKYKLTDQRWVERQDKVGGSGVIVNFGDHTSQLSLSDLATLMIVLSDNTATNMVLERITTDAVNAYLDKIGIRTTRVLRKIRGDGNQLKSASGWSAAGKLAENQKYGLGLSTPRDMVAILEKLERGEIVSPDASREMIAILKRCQDKSGIRRRFGEIPVANKTGTLDALRSDVGIVYSKGGRIAMAITVDGMSKIDYAPDNAGSLLIADLAKILVDGLAQR